MSALGLEERSEARAYGLLVVGDESADHGAASVVGSVTSTSKPPPSAGPEREGAAGERCAFAHSHQSVALDRLTVGCARAVVPDPQVECLVAIGDLDVDVCARGVASCVRQRLLDDPVGGQIDAQR